MTTLAELRKEFNGTPASCLARQVGCAERSMIKASARFAYFEDDSRFAIVAGAQEGTDVQRALAIGLTLAKGRRLTLVLPEGHTRATQQRTPWLHERVHPELFVHGNDVAEPLSMLHREATLAALADARKGVSPADEMNAVASPLHLGGRTAGVAGLMEWATTHRRLDPGHRRSERSWSCLGQRVLSIRRTTAGLAVRAGIHTGGPGDASVAVAVSDRQPLSDRETKALQEAVEAGIGARLSGNYRKPDEHWLQAVIRKEPSLVGVEQPALRELPAWRPSDSTAEWGRGYIDLIGIDGQGDIRLVETKLAANKDDLLVFQGLDYYIWARAYAEMLRERLGVTKKAKVVLHYVIGATPNGEAHVSAYAPAQAAALDIGDWRCQIVTDWYGTDRRVHSELLPVRTLAA